MLLTVLERTSQQEVQL